MLRDELILAVSRAAGLPIGQAGLAVAEVLRFFTARLPSALVGELHARLDTPSPSLDDGATAATTPPERRP